MAQDFCLFLRDFYMDFGQTFINVSLLYLSNLALAAEWAISALENVTVSFKGIWWFVSELNLPVCGWHYKPSAEEQS